MIIVAVKEGLDEVEDIARTLRLPGDIVGGLVSRLLDQGYLRIRDKNLLFVKRKVLELTDKGIREYPHAYDLVKKASERITELWRKGEKIPEDLMLLASFLSELGLLNENIAAELGVKKGGEAEDIEKEIEAAEEASNMDLT